MNFLALALFAFVAGGTPGPNNIMLMASGTNFGLRRTLPHMAGILSGVFSILILVGSGLGSIFQNYPALFPFLRWCGAFYILFIAYRIVRAGQVATEDKMKQPLRFFEAFLFQYLNVKAWAMSISVFAWFGNPGWFYLWNALSIASVFVVVIIPGLFFWTSLGFFLRRYLQSPRALTVFNWAMASLLVLSIGLLFL